MSLAAATAAGARASLVLSSSSSSRPILLALPCHRRPYRSLASPAASRWSRGRRRLQVRAARTESTGVAVGFRAPQFELREPLTGKVWTLDDFEGDPALLMLAGTASNYRVIVDRQKMLIQRFLEAKSSALKVNESVRAGCFVMFICNHCPFVKHLKKDIVKLTSFYMEKGLAAVAISSNSIATHPQDGPKYMAEEAKKFRYPFPYLYDESQEVAKAFGAVCTPEFYLFKKDGRRPFELFYHGQFDDSRPSNNVPVTGRDLSRAIDCALSGQELPFVQKPSVGCSIKWHP